MHPPCLPTFGSQQCLQVVQKFCIGSLDRSRLPVQQSDEASRVLEEAGQDSGRPLDDEVQGELQQMLDLVFSPWQIFCDASWAKSSGVEEAAG